MRMPMFTPVSGNGGSYCWNMTTTEPSQANKKENPEEANVNKSGLYLFSICNLSLFCCVTHCYDTVLRNDGRYCLNMTKTEPLLLSILREIKKKESRRSKKNKNQGY